MTRRWTICMKPSIRARAALSFVLAAALLTGTAPAQDGAENYPSQTVRIIVPFAPGGSTDLLARLLADHLGRRWSATVVVENRAGGAGNAGMAFVAKSPPDGHVLVIAPVGNAVVAPLLFKDLPYDPVKDLAPIGQLATVENVLVVNAKSDIASLDRLIVRAGSGGARLTYSTPGAGSIAHLATEMLARAKGIELIHVPYRGLTPALTDVLGGRITMTFAQLANARPFIENGQLRALALASSKRSAALPGVPTVEEAARLPGFEAVSWYALMAPARTPEAVIAKINREVEAFLHLPEVVSALEALGAKPAGTTPEELARIMAQDTARWSKVIRDSHIEVN
jgi:tripartite-type tricarboxylate transporter receptor subunit TctC